MVEVAAMTRETVDMRVVGEEVARALSYARVRGHSAFVSTSVRYPNGASVVVRIDEHPEGFYVWDDGHAALLADMMGAIHSFTRLAVTVGQRTGVSFDQRAFFVGAVPRSNLPAAVAAVANASGRAAERTIYAMEQYKAKKSRDLFNNRLIEAYGERVAFDVEIIGSTGREWDYEAGVMDGKIFTKLFALVSPAFTAVAAANMKITDTRNLDEPPQITVALSDYKNTEPSLRAILSGSADVVIAANDDIEHYRLTS